MENKMYATIVDRTLNVLPGDGPTLEEMQAVVGGYICTGLRGDSPTDPNIEIDVYVNDEGLCINLPIDHVRKTDGSPLAGNLVITGADKRTGEQVGLSLAEIRSILPYIGRLPITMTPEDFGF